MKNITFDTNNNLTIDVKPIVKIKNTISIVGFNRELPVDIIADFTNIPKHLHEIYLTSFQSKYYIDIRAWANTDTETPEPKTIEEQKSDWRKNKIVDLILGKLK